MCMNIFLQTPAVKHFSSKCAIQITFTTYSTVNILDAAPTSHLKGGQDRLMDRKVTFLCLRESTFSHH